MVPTAEKEKPKQLRLWLKPSLYLALEQVRLKEGKLNMKTRDFAHQLLEDAIGNK